MVSGAMAVLVLVGSFAVPAAAGASADPPAPISPEVREQLDSQGEASVLVEMSAEGVDDADVDEVRSELVDEGGEVLSGDQTLVATTLDEEKAEVLSSSPGVKRVLPNRSYVLEATPGLEMVRAPQAWSHAEGAGQRIAVIDTGIDRFHPNLLGKVEAEACFSATGVSGTTVHPLCPGGGGHKALGPGSGMPCAIGGSCAHGTHVAGIAASTAPGASLLSVQVFSFSTDPTTCRGTHLTPCLVTFDSDLIAALGWVREQVSEGSVAAVNMSIGGSASAAACDESGLSSPIAELHDLGVATVVASGNDGSPHQMTWPACITQAVAVGSVDANFMVSDFSNSSPMLDFLAPGRYITSAIPGGGFATMSGTSMAAPHVSGAFALLREVKATASVDQLSTILRETGLRLFDFRNGRLTPFPRLDSATSDIAPIGYLDDVAVSGSTALVTGWALDLDVDAPLEATVLVDGEVAWSGLAWYSRAEVAASYPGFGPGHGVLAPVQLPKGLSEVCLVARDASWPDRPPVEIGCHFALVEDDVLVLPPAVFDDVSLKHPFFAEIAWMSNSGIAEGFPNGAFEPSSTLSRQAMAAFLYRQAGSPDGIDPSCSTPPFADVSTRNPFCGEISWLKQQGITSGFADATFKPGQGLTRQAMAAFLYRQAGSPDGIDPSCSAPPFADVSMGNTFCGEISWLSRTGISQGFDNFFFQPASLITRQAIAAFLYRYGRLP